MDCPGLNGLSDDGHDVLNSLRVEDVIDAHVLELLLQLAPQRAEQQDSGLLPRHVAAHLEHPDVDLPLPFAERGDVILVIVPGRWDRRLSAAVLDARHWSFQ